MPTGIRRISALVMTTGVLLSTFIGASASSADEPEPPVKQPQTKQCVVTESGTRQTEDPNSPPCVPFYDGDNGGATWQGVTVDTITLLIYVTRESSDPQPGTYCDLDARDCDGDGIPEDRVGEKMKVASTFSMYFNQRFQTYGRRVQTWMYFARPDATPSSRRADAADNWDRLRPFAVLDLAEAAGSNDVYAIAMARRNVMVLASPAAMRNDFHLRYAPFIWSFWPDIENAAFQYSRYVCDKVAATTVTGGRHSGEPRKYALYHSSHTNDAYFADLVKHAVSDCGVEIEDEFTFSDGTALRDALAMKSGGYNTILWTGGSNTAVSRWSSIIGHSPEWIVAGDGLLESNSYGRQQGQRTWANAWVQSSRPRVGHWQEDPAYSAYRETNPEGSPSYWVSRMYPEFFLTFLSIQLAGEALTPFTVETGLRAKPPTSSTSPYVVGGHFAPGDFTFVKDASESWWDPTGNTRDGLGCYRLVQGGVRYRASEWSLATDAGIGHGVAKDPNRDPCSGYSRPSELGPSIPLIG